jgi:hypothetical protein
MRTCANCISPSTLKCSACVEGIIYGETSETSVWYCSASCQRSHCSTTHKKDCKLRNARKTPYRMGQYAQAFFYKLRELSFYVCFDKVWYDEGDGKIHVYKAAVGDA